ncbi:hypothetical protein G6514_000860 [Epicoccum nigrum]|nr:hypothetical protein G6514_000860 [Epicoccum nigrum]
MPTKRYSEEIDAVEEFPSPHPSTNKRLKTNRATWSELPGELRNCIYECFLALEAESSHYIIHRSSDDKLNLDSGSASNFSSSFWSLTQMSMSMFFHPVDEQSGTYTGWIKPIPPLICGIPLPTRGMDISKAIKHRLFDSTCFVDLEKQHDLDPMCNTLCALHHGKAWQGYCAQTFNIQSISLTPYQNGVWDGMHKVPCRVSKPSVDHDALLKIKCGPSFTPDGQQRTPEQQMRCFSHWFYYEAELDLCQSVKVLVSVPEYKTMWTALEPGYCYAKWERFGDERETVFRTHWKVKSKMTLEDSKEVEAVMDRGWYAESYE